MKCKFKIGQKVVALHDYVARNMNNENKFIFKKGEIYEVIDIKRSCCQWTIKININNNIIMNLYCGSCHNNIIKEDTPYFNQDRFAPLEDNKSSFTYEDAIQLVSTKKLEIVDL